MEATEGRRVTGTPDSYVYLGNSLVASREYEDIWAFIDFNECM